MSGYIKYIREMVGHAPVLQCGASVIVVNECGELLLQKRRDNGSWGCTGGGVDLDEVVEEAAKRELFEETGLVADSLVLFGVFSGPHMHYVYPNGDEVSNVDIVYLCHSWSGEMIADPSEVSELRFFPVNDLPSDISPPQVSVLQEYVRRSQEADTESVEEDGFVLRRAAAADIRRLGQIDHLGRYVEIGQWVERGECFVIEEGGQVLGFAAMTYSFFGNGFVELLVIGPEHRRRGLGGRMLEFLLRSCRTHRLFTSTNKSNAAMRGLLAKAGFLPCGQVDALDEGDPELFYVKRKTE